jgi:hypothetical protein
VNRATLHLRDDQQEAVEEMYRDSCSREDVEALSKAEIFRRLIDVGLSNVEEADDTLAEIVPEHVRVEHERERIKRENRVADLRGGFRGRVRDQLRRRFKNGYDPEHIAAVATGYLREAGILFEGDARQEAEEYVSQVVERYREAYEASEYDPDGEDPFSVFDGVRLGRDVEDDEMEALIDDAETRLRDARSRLTNPDPDAIAHILTKYHDVERETANEAVREAQQRINERED